jgi:hypothetical protein
MPSETQPQVHINRLSKKLDGELKQLADNENRSKRQVAAMLLELGLMAFHISGFTNLTDWQSYLRKKVQY